jgi:hypothetical protein
LEELSYPRILQSDRYGYEEWAQNFKSVISIRQAAGELIYNSAYIVSTNGRKMIKHEYLLAEVFKPAWLARGRIEGTMGYKGITLANLHEELTTIMGLGSFMAGQVINDLKHWQMKKAPDWWTFAVPGPGSRRGLNRVLGRDKDAPWPVSDWDDEMEILYERIAQMCAAEGMPRLDKSNLQNSLCEVDKWWRVKLGEGRPRSLYPGV